MSENSIVKATDINTALGAEVGTMICSIENDGDRKKAAQIANALNNPEYRVADFINKTIEVRDILIEIREIMNEETGEIAKVPRVVLMDDDGKGYQATSVGIFNSVKSATVAFGAAPWEPALKFLIKQKAVGKGSMLTAEIQG